MAGALIVLFAGSFWFSERPFYWALIAALLFFGLARFVPWVLLPLNLLWEQFALKAALLGNAVILGFVFFCLIMPLGICLRLMKKSLLRTGFESQAGTYFQPVGRQFSPSMQEDMF